MKKLIVSLSLVIACMYTCNRTNKPLSKIINNVFNEINLPESVFLIEANKDTFLTGKSGTHIRINKNSFIDKNGNTVDGAVKIELKEALSRADIVLGNMTTLSNGRILQSGGMIYLNATKDSENLSIASNCSLEVAVPTSNKKDCMQIYTGEYDIQTKKLNWTNPQNLMVQVTHSDISETSTEASTSHLKQEINIAKIENREMQNIESPQKPEKYMRGSDTILSLIFDTSSFPELSQYRNVKFKLMDNTNFNAEDSKIIWMSIDLKKTEEIGLYTIYFSGLNNGGLVEKNYKVSPVFEAGSDYKAAMEKYNQKYKEFENKKEAIEKQRIENEKQQKLAREKDEEKRKIEIAEQQKLQKESGLNPYITDPNTYYIFNLNKFGWTNIDKLYSNPNCQVVDLNTRIENQDEFNNIFISMIFEKENVNLTGYEKKDKTYGFTGGDFEKAILPVGEKAIIVATAYKNEKPFFAILKITINKKQNVSLQMVETTIEKLKAEILYKI